jgi:hypothetical protein
VKKRRVATHTRTSYLGNKISPAWSLAATILNAQVLRPSSLLSYIPLRVCGSVIPTLHIRHPSTHHPRFRTPLQIC